MPNGTASAKLPISTGRMKPSTSISQIAAANAQATCVPMPSALARRYMRTHQSSTDIVMKKPAMRHQPPSFKGGIERPYLAGGGSSASQGSWRTNCTGSQLTEASMLSPTVSNAMKKQSSDAMPKPPR